MLNTFRENKKLLYLSTCFLALGTVADYFAVHENIFVGILLTFVMIMHVLGIVALQIEGIKQNEEIEESQVFANRVFVNWNYIFPIGITACICYLPKLEWLNYVLIIILSIAYLITVIKTENSTKKKESFYMVCFTCICFLIMLYYNLPVLIF